MLDLLLPTHQCVLFTQTLNIRTKRNKLWHDEQAVTAPPALWNSRRRKSADFSWECPRALKVEQCKRHLDMSFGGVWINGVSHWSSSLSIVSLCTDWTLGCHFRFELMHVV